MREETVMVPVQCILDKFLVVPTFVARWLYVCKDARELFVESLSCNFREMTASSPFMYMFLATNLRQGNNGDIDVMLGMC